MGKKLTRDYVEFQSDRIEAVLASHKIPVQVSGGVIAPGWVRFHFTAAPAAKVSKIRSLTEEIALALGTPTVRVARDGDTLAIEVPRSDREPIPLLPFLRNVMAHGSLGPITACLGVTQDGRPLLMRLPSPDVAHMLVAGATGSGKTEVMRCILTSLALTNRRHKLQMALIDPKSRGFGPLGFFPHLLAPIATNVKTAVELLNRLVGEMDRRDSLGLSSPHIVIAVDEVVDLMMVGGKQVETALVRIAQRGREAGLHLILGAQKPSSSLLGPNLKSNLPVRLVGRVGSVEDARVATGISGSGAEKLTGQGDFVVVAAGESLHFQAAYVGPEDQEALQHIILGRAPLMPIIREDDF